MMHRPCGNASVASTKSTHLEGRELVGISKRSYFLCANFVRFHPLFTCIESAANFAALMFLVRQQEESSVHPTNSMVY
jgi:hypothetical protein